MINSTELPWQHPLTLAYMLEEYEHAAMLYSGAAGDKERHYSYICLGAEQVCSGSELAKLKANISTDKLWYENFWIGWLGYGLKNQLEELPADQPSPIQTDDYAFFKPKTIYRFDHQTHRVICIGEHVLEAHWQATPPQGTKATAVDTLHSNMTKQSYLAYVECILEHIRAGTIYQANLTRKFHGTFKSEPSATHLFTELCHASPANYSALIYMGGVQVASSSPELFIQVDDNGTISTRPIKGTIGRSDDAEADAKLKQALANSTKDKAENLMIVDLMRNDLSRICEMGSVSVDALFDITTHAHIHHMSSLVHGQLARNANPVDALTACFPPGSMTGAPKIKAMEICSQLERLDRGVYSGALGWFAGDGTAHFSVVIRTIILQGNQFEFQVGGGIVADSVAEKEYQETLEKAKGVCEALGISLDKVQAL